jgi:hypothetical protein
MSAPVKVPLFRRLPEIYRVRDGEQFPTGQLQGYLAPIEALFSAIHENIEQLYDDLFIETCSDWVIPYLADLVGTTHLSGDPHTIRADVADTIALRRRKGTLAGIERLVTNLTEWATHCVELRERLGWTQHLNHQRPDDGGLPPYRDASRLTVPRGGTVPIRDPALLRLLDTPFDPFARTAEVRPADDGQVHVNLPNLAIFLWRLEAYRLGVTKPLYKGFGTIASPDPGEATFAVHFDLDPLDRPVRLFNTWQTEVRRDPPTLTEVDRVPGPILDARLTTGAPAGNPDAYVSVDTYTPPAGLLSDFDASDSGLQFFLPNPPFPPSRVWTFRGDNLCGWETGLRRPLLESEIVIDPDIGRVLIGVRTEPERLELRDELRVGYTYGAMRRVGAHPISRPVAPVTLFNEPVDLRRVTGMAGGQTLQAALANIHNSPQPIVVEIADSLVHSLDLSTLGGVVVEGGELTMRLNRSLIIRAASNQRPVVRLSHPLRFRPTNVQVAAGGDQQALDAINRNLLVRLEGIFLARDAAFPTGEALIARAAVARLEIQDSTLDPGGHRLRDPLATPAGSTMVGRAALWPALHLARDLGFADPAERRAFPPTPDILLQFSIAGALRLDDAYALVLEDSIIDAGLGPDGVPQNTEADLAIAALTGPTVNYAPATRVCGVTIFGRTRVEELRGSGGIFTHRVRVHQNQVGCLSFCWFSGDGDRLPPHQACVRRPDARLVFTSEWFNDAAYGQLAAATDRRVREVGPGDDEMGAFGFLKEAHKRRNLSIRFREFMPVGVRPVVVTVT